MFSLILRNLRHCPVCALHKLSWERHCIFIGFTVSEVPLRTYFHKGLSLTALSFVPSWNHLAFHLSFQLNLFCQRQGALKQGPHIVHGTAEDFKKKEKKEDETLRDGSRTTEWSQSVSVLSEFVLHPSWLAMLWIGNQTALLIFSVYHSDWKWFIVWAQCEHSLH